MSLLSTIKTIPNKKLWIGVIVSIIILIFILLPSFFTIENIEIQGNEYLKKSIILEAFPQEKITFWSLDKKKVLSTLLQNPFIENVSLKTKSFHTLIVDIKLVNLVGKTKRFGILEYITQKGEFKTGDFLNLSFFIPEIIISKDLKYEKILFLSEQLAIFKYSYPDFFKRIRKIDLLDTTNVSIFITNDALGVLKEYRLYHFPSVEDFIKIELLDRKYNQGSVIIIDGESVIVQN